jgi:putative transcriptional regulator
MKQQVLNNCIQEKRKQAAMTQQDLATAVGVTRQTVIAVEKGNYVPSVALALSLAHTFQSSVEQLFFYES